MEIFIFDMDSVLLNPEGYHRALQETVRLAGVSLGFGNIQLTKGQINKFEAFGISSEWHSSALCMAVLTLESRNPEVAPHYRNTSEVNASETPALEIGLGELFEELSAQSLEIPAIQRAATAIENLASKENLDPEPALKWICESESIDLSLTMNSFQELILGSETFEKTYGKKAKLKTESYLQLFDVPLITSSNAGKLKDWVDHSNHGAAIMTNRPSNTLLGKAGTPEAEKGAQVVGLESIPIVGYGELLWLADRFESEAVRFNKPAWQHAMAATLLAVGFPVDQSLMWVGRDFADWDIQDLGCLQGSIITVFEDTPAGLISAKEAGEILNILGVEVETRLIGVTENDSKHSALVSNGAKVFPSVNHALEAFQVL